MRTVPRKDAAEAFLDTSWGLPHAEEVEVDDPDLPDKLTEWGRLIEIHLNRPKSNPNGKEKSTSIKLSGHEQENSHLAFDPAQQDGRLYLVLEEGLHDQMREEFWDKSKMNPRPLWEVARMAGGRHGRRDDYPDVEVKPIGIVTGLMYGRNKRGDDYSWYIHKMGEESGIQPVLTVGNDGRLWIAGGNYQSLIPGITD